MGWNGMDEIQVNLIIGCINIDHINRCIYSIYHKHLGVSVFQVFINQLWIIFSSSSILEMRLSILCHLDLVDGETRSFGKIMGGKEHCIVSVSLE